MNPWQMAQQIKAELEAVTWPAGDGDIPVFGTRGRVAIFAGFPTEEQIPPGFPWCLVTIDGGTADEDSPELIEQGFTLITSADVAGDPLGEFSIIGSSVDSLNQSAGRGVAEIEERIRYAVQDLTGADGASIVVSASNTGRPVPLGRGRHLALTEISLTALCTSALYYAPPQNLQYDVNWTWDGAQCSDRFDFVKYRIVDKTGTTPATSPDDPDGTIIYTGTGTTHTDAALSGHTYTVFADYSARRRTSAGLIVVEGSSSPEVGSYRVVV